MTLFASTLVGAGFDCSKATHGLERRICSDSILARLDDSLALSWASTLAAFGPSRKQALRKEQREWLSILRQDTPDAPHLREAWRHRLRELALKRSQRDLDSLVGTISPPETWRLANSGSCGWMDFQTGEPKMGPTADILELSVRPGSGILHFRMTSGIDQPQCHSCEVESDVPLVASKPRRWSTGSDENRAWGSMEFFPDSIVVVVDSLNQSFFCGIGASLVGTYRFHRHSLRLVPTGPLP